MQDMDSAHILSHVRLLYKKSRVLQRIFLLQAHRLPSDLQSEAVVPENTVQPHIFPDDKYHALAQKYMKDGLTCCVISFELTGGRDAAVRFMYRLKLATIATHVAASITMVLHPASHTHRQMNDEQLVEAGVSPGMIRLSIGIENVDDIIKDLEQALKNA